MNHTIVENVRETRLAEVGDVEIVFVPRMETLPALDMFAPAPLRPLAKDLLAIGADHGPEAVARARKLFNDGYQIGRAHV